AIREALKLPLPEGHSLLELRNEALACLVLADVERGPEPRPLPTGTRAWALDAACARIAVMDGAGAVSVRRLADDRVLCRLPAAGTNSGTGTSLVLSHDGGRLAVYGHPANGLRLWRLDGAQPAPGRAIDPGMETPTFAFDPAGGLLAVEHSDTSVRFYDTTTGAAAGRVAFGKDVDALAFHPRRPWLAVGGEGAVRVFDLTSGAAVADLG